TLFAIGSTTNTNGTYSTTTLFSISNTGVVTGQNFSFVSGTTSALAVNGSTTISSVLNVGGLFNANGGLTSYASSTIGNGNQNGGLTINGGATTTGNASIGGVLAIGTSTVPNGAQLFVYNNNTSGSVPAILIGGNPGGDTDFWIGR